MEINEAVAKFKAELKTFSAYDHAIGVMYYDMETAAPKNASAGLGETMGTLSEITYKLSVNEERFALIDFLMEHREMLDHITRREVEEANRELQNMRRIPIDEYVEFQKLLAVSQSAWQEAKTSDDYSIFEPYLAKIVDFVRRVAAYVNPQMNPYDYWLDQFERGMNTEVLDRYFASVKAALVPLIKRVVAKNDSIKDDFLNKPYPVETQRKLSDYLMQVMCINRDDCAIGETEHPFTTNFNKHDVRITTHYYENMFASSMYSVIHEGGHALYELNTGDDLLESPLARGASMGIHESQSRFFENIIGRSEAFIELIFPKLTELFPEQLNGVTPHMLYLAVNKAVPSLIRTEADELTYSLHIMIRYEIEKRLIGGSLDTHELPAEWNRLYKEYLGVDVPCDREGVLQDSHWSGGSLGYFPSYSLGSAYGAQILAHMRKQLDIDSLIRSGNMQQIIDWLSERIYKYGALLKPDELIMNCCGEPFNPQYYIDYLVGKYTELYHLD